MPVVSNVPDATEKGDLSSDYRSGACQSEDFVDNGYVQGEIHLNVLYVATTIDNPNQCQDIYYLPPGYQEIPNMTVYYPNVVCVVAGCGSNVPGNNNGAFFGMGDILEQNSTTQRLLNINVVSPAATGTYQRTYFSP